MSADPTVLGWDVGGAHLKVAVLHGGRIGHVGQVACPLWQGLDRLETALDALLEALPVGVDLTAAHHAITMTGELVDAFEHREAGVAAITATLAQRFGAGRLRLYAGAVDDQPRWLLADEAVAHWPRIASANWRATAEAVTVYELDALLVDIGSTTTDLVALRGGAVASHSLSDLDRLASGELAYHGVVRTPLCALGPRVRWQGREVNLMNEWFATSADVYRLTGELDPAHDQHPSADGAAKDAPCTRRRLARLIGLDARDATDADWLALAQQFRAAQLAELALNARRVIATADLPAAAPLIAAGAGAFLVAELAQTLGRPWHFIDDPWPVDATCRAWTRVAAPSAAVALLLAADVR
jgi:(4-(4-[2-(gamma-L-glutamylamino)ethyl]phenoxymethyl)furan-2-yl)methanamine synthase